MANGSITTAADGLSASLDFGGTPVVVWDGTGITSGVKATAISVDSTQSMVRVNTANGYGSTNTQVRRFSTVVTNQGSDITYADSASLGATFTINTNGVYAVSYSDQFTVAGQNMAVTLNTASTSWAIPSEFLCGVMTSSANYASCASGSFYLPAGSVVRALASGTTGASASFGLFTITRVA